MNIAMFTCNYKPFVGGVPISIERLANGLRKAGHRVYIFAPQSKKQIYEPDIFRYKTHSFKVLDGEVTLPYTFDMNVYNTFSQLKIDVIHTHHPAVCGWTALLLGKKYNIPVVYTYHTRYEEYIHNIRFLNFFERISKKTNLKTGKLSEKFIKNLKDEIIPNYIKSFCNKCDLVFSPSLTAAEYLNSIGVVKEKVVIPTGIPNCFFEQKSQKAQELREMYKGDKQFLFCTVSRISKEKNIGFILDGVCRLKSDIGDCFNLLFLGDGPDIEKYSQYAKSLGIENNIKFLGNIPNGEITDFYIASDLFLFASKSETQGIVLLEAMGCGTPVVALSASGIDDLVENGVNGFKTKDDVSDWVCAIKKIIENPSLLYSMQQSAFETAAKYSEPNITQLAEEGYKKSIFHHSF